MSITNYAMPIRSFSARLNSPAWESIKEGLRWVIAFALSILITELLAQTEVIPEFSCMRWGTGVPFCIHIRQYAVPILTVLGKMLDTYLHEKTPDGGLPRGFIPL